MEDLRHQLIKRRYFLTKEIGRGGMAQIYLAQDRQLNRQVVVKMVREDLLQTSEADDIRKQFMAEARSLVGFHHPNIIPIYDFGHFRERPFMVMEYLPNDSLSRRMSQFHNHKTSAHLLAQMADALSYSHSQGVIHRDVKPDNILFDVNDNPKLTDFGVAYWIPAIENKQNLEKEPEMLLGTPEYMAPERWDGKTIPQSDQYALGVIFYELLTGEWPYSGTSPWEVGEQHLKSPVKSVRENLPFIPFKVDAVIQRMMAKAPQERFKNLKVAAAVLRAIEQIPLTEGEIRRERKTRQLRKPKFLSVVG